MQAISLLMLALSCAALPHEPPFTSATRSSTALSSRTVSHTVRPHPSSPATIKAKRDKPKDTPHIRSFNDPHCKINATSRAVPLENHKCIAVTMTGPYYHVVLPPESHVIWLYGDLYCGDAEYRRLALFVQTIAGVNGTDGCFKAETEDIFSFYASDEDPEAGKNGKKGRTPKDDGTVAALQLGYGP